MNTEVYTVQEVSKKLKCNKNYVYDLIKHGHITALKLGSFKITSFELEDFLSRNSGKDMTDLNNIVDINF